MQCSSTSTFFKTSTSTPFKSSTSTRERTVNLKRKVVSDAYPEFGKNKKVVKRSVDKGKGLMVDEDEAFNRNKPVLPRPGGIVIIEDGSMKKTSGVGLVNVGATGAGFLRPRSCVNIANYMLGLRAPRSLGNEKWWYFD